MPDLKYTVTDIKQLQDWRKLQNKGPKSKIPDGEVDIDSIKKITFATSIQTFDDEFPMFKNVTHVTFMNLKNIKREFYHYFPNITHITCHLLTSLPIIEKKWGAFSLLSNLKEVNLPSVKSVGKEAFCICNSLKSVNLPKAEVIGDEAFNECGNLKEVNLPSVKSVGEKAFCSCNSLKEVNLPSVKSVGKKAFSSCESLESVNLPNAQVIGDNAFEWCDNLKEVNMPSVKSVGKKVFFSCNSLESVKLPKAEVIGDEAFNYCSNLKEVNLPNAKVIRKRAFNVCKLLESFKAPNFSGDISKICVDTPKNCKTAILNVREKTETIGDKTEKITKITCKNDDIFTYLDYEITMEDVLKEVKLFPKDGKPHIKEVEQSNIGDCWLMSSLISLVKTEPEAIKNCLEDCGDYVIVKLYDVDLGCSPDQTKFTVSPKEKLKIKLKKSIPYIKCEDKVNFITDFIVKTSGISNFYSRNKLSKAIKLLLDSDFKALSDMPKAQQKALAPLKELNLSKNSEMAFSPNSALWVNMIEKAFAATKIGPKFKICRNLTFYDTAGKYDNIEGGLEAIALAAITGRTFKSKVLQQNDNPDKVFEKIKRKLDLNEPLTVAAFSAEMGRIGGHVYSIVDAYVDNGKKYVVMKDPNGPSAMTIPGIKAGKKGTFSIEISQFVKKFDQITTQKSK